MASYSYDGSFEGLLSCIFTAYRDKCVPDNIVDNQQSQSDLLADGTPVITNDQWAARVLKGVSGRTQARAAELIYHMFLSELPQIEMAIFHFIKTIIDSSSPAILENFANPFVLKANQIDKMIHREVHRMHAFVRFEKSESGIFFAAVEPDFNVMPLIGEHFERRYADQRWVIFDTRRHYGLYYDLRQTVDIMDGDPVFDEIGEEQGGQYQVLWKEYFQAVNIRERENARLQLRRMPRRYWRYLIEKG